MLIKKDNKAKIIIMGDLKKIFMKKLKFIKKIWAESNYTGY